MPAPQWNRGHRVHALPSQSDPDHEVDHTYLPASQPEPQTLPSNTLERPRECINRFSTPPFSLLCSIMDRLRTEDPTKRKSTLERFFGIWRVKVGNDLYPLIRLLLPDVSLVSDLQSSGKDQEPADHTAR